MTGAGAWLQNKIFGQCTDAYVHISDIHTDAAQLGHIYISDGGSGVGKRSRIATIHSSASVRRLFSLKKARRRGGWRATGAWLRGRNGEGGCGWVGGEEAGAGRAGNILGGGGKAHLASRQSRAAAALLAGRVRRGGRFVVV